MRLLKWVRAYFQKSFFRKNVMILAGGAAVAQLIQLLAYPILMRLYSPGEFGVLSTYAAIVSMLAVAASGRYEAAIMLPDADSDAFGLVCLAGFITAIWSVLVLLVVLGINGQAFQWVVGLQLGGWLLWIPLAVLLMGLSQVLVAWLHRGGRYGEMSKNRVAQTVVTVGVGGLSSGISGGLIVGQLAGVLVSVVELLVRVCWNLTPQQKGGGSILNVKKLAIEYRYFPLHSMPGTLFSVAASQVPYLMIASIFSGSALGHFAFAISIIQAPLSLISRSVGSVYYQVASEVGSLRELRRITYETQRKMAFFVVPLAIFVMVFGEPMFEFFFGEQWRLSGRYAAILMPYLALYSIVGATRDYIFLVRVRGFELIFNAGVFFALSLAVLLGARMQSFDVAVLAYSVAGSLAFLVLAFWMYSPYVGAVDHLE